VHNWEHKAETQSEGGYSPHYVAVHKTVIQFKNEQDWLYAAVDPDTNELLQMEPEPTRTNVLANAFFTKPREKQDVDGAKFLVDSTAALIDACTRNGLDL
jgi:putative transposase